MIDEMINENEKIYTEIKQFILKRYTFYTRMVFKNEDLFPPLKVYTREMMNNKIFDLVQHMFAKKQEQGVILNTPKTWRDWIKEKHKHKKWMKWIIKRFSIKYNHHHYILNEYTTFPNLSIPSNFDEKLELVYVYYDHKYEGVKTIEDDKDIDN